MKKLTMLALFVASLVCAGQALAVDWFPAQELGEEEIAAIRNATGVWKIPDGIAEFAWLNGGVLALAMVDGSLAIYGSGGENNEKSETAPNTELLADSEYSIKQNRDTPLLTDAEILKSLVVGLETRLYKMKWDKKYDYTETDALFSKIVEALIATTFLEEDTWPHIKSDSNTRYAIETLASPGIQHWERYGAPAIKLLELLSQKYLRNELLSNNLRGSFENMIRIREDDDFYAGPETSKPSAKEQIIYAEKLLKFYEDRPDTYILIFEDDGYKDTMEERLKEIAPEILQRLRTLKIERLRG